MKKSNHFTRENLIKELKANGVKIGVASSSKNCSYILEVAGIQEYFGTRVDGEVSAKLGLKGKPQGDIFVKAAQNLEAEPANSVVVEDALMGLRAAKSAGMKCIMVEDEFTKFQDHSLADDKIYSMEKLPAAINKLK